MFLLTGGYRRKNGRVVLLGDQVYVDDSQCFALKRQNRRLAAANLA
jgi:hypothetical protein